MVGNPDPNIGRVLFVWGKIGFYEITSLFTLSLAFWFAVIPLVTTGSALLSLFDTIRGIYTGNAPMGERARLRQFRQSLRTNFTRGLPLTALIILLLVNTYAYLAIGWGGRNPAYLVGGIVSIYLCLLATLIVLRVAHLMSRDGSTLLRAIKEGGRSWWADLDYGVLQIMAATIVIILAFVLLPAVVCLLPASLVLLEIVFYHELVGNDPRTVLERYAVKAT